jgi:hypothetical protein
MDRAEPVQEAGESDEAIAPAPSPQSLAEAHAHTAAVTDPELRAKLTDMIAQALSRQRTPSKR